MSYMADANSDSRHIKSSEHDSDFEVIPNLAQFDKLKMFKTMNHQFNNIRELRMIKKESMNDNDKLIKELESLKSENECMNMKLKELQDKEDKINLVLFGFNIQRDTRVLGFIEKSTSSYKEIIFMSASNYTDENYYLIASCMSPSYEKVKLLKKTEHDSKNYQKKLPIAESTRKKTFDEKNLETDPELDNESKESRFTKTSHDSHKRAVYQVWKQT